MKTLSGPALVVAAVLTSPALWAAATGALPLDVALVRYLLAAGVCGVLLSLADGWVRTSGAQASPAAGVASEAVAPGASGASGAPGASGASGEGLGVDSGAVSGAEGTAPYAGSGLA